MRTIVYALIATSLVACKLPEGYEGGLSFGTQVNGTPVSVGLVVRKRSSKAVLNIQPGSK